MEVQSPSASDSATPSSWYSHPSYTGKSPARISFFWTVLGLFFKFWKTAFLLAAFLLPLAARFYFSYISKPEPKAASQASGSATNPAPHTASPSSSPGLGTQEMDGSYWNHRNGFSVRGEPAQYRVVDPGKSCVAVTDLNTLDDCNPTTLPTMIHKELGWALSSYRIIAGVALPVPQGAGQTVLLGNISGTIYPATQVKQEPLPVFQQIATASIGRTPYAVYAYSNFTEPVNQKYAEENFKRFLAGIKVFGLGT